MRSITRTIIIISIFSIAMAALEGAVVVYLRALYYPGEFTVAFKLIKERILIVELIRELATLIMLWGISFLAGKNFRERFAYFLISFAIWDIAYYAWLKIFINWPSSILAWDILFLIPFAWLGPVLAPIICSMTMVLLATALLRTDKRISLAVWSLLISGSTLILFTFLKDYGMIMISNGFLSEYSHLLRNQDFIKIASGYIPKSYSWNIFWVGETCIVLGIITYRWSWWKIKMLRSNLWRRYA